VPIDAIEPGPVLISGSGRSRPIEGIVFHFT